MNFTPPSSQDRCEPQPLMSIKEVEQGKINMIGSGAAGRPGGNYPPPIGRSATRFGLSGRNRSSPGPPVLGSARNPGQHRNDGWTIIGSLSSREVIAGLMGMEWTADSESTHDVQT